MTKLEEITGQLEDAYLALCYVEKLIDDDAAANELKLTGMHGLDCLQLLRTAEALTVQTAGIVGAKFKVTQKQTSAG